MIDMLRTGIVPAGDAPWMGKEPQLVLNEPRFAAMERDWSLRSGKPRISTLRDWKKFCSRSEGEAFHALQQDFEIIKKYFEARGVIGDHGGQMKMDTKDVPLRFYQEAAELLPVGEMCSRMATQAKRCDVYRRASWGEYSGPRRAPVDEAGMMDRAQLAPLMEFFAKIAPMEIAASAITGRSGLDERAMRAVDAFVQPVVNSDDWRQRVLAGQPAKIAR